MTIQHIHIEGVFELFAMPNPRPVKLKHANNNIDKYGRHKFVQGLCDRQHTTRRPLFNFLSQNKYRPNGEAIWPEMAVKCKG